MQKPSKFLLVGIRKRRFTFYSRYLLRVPFWYRSYSIIPSFNLMSVTFLHIVCDSAAIWWRYPRWIWQLTESRKLWIPVFTYTSTSFRFLFLHFLIVVFLTLFWPLCWFSTSTMLDTSLTYNENNMKHLLVFALLNIPFIIQSDLRWRGYKAYYILGSQVNQMCLYLCRDT